MSPAENSKNPDFLPTERTRIKRLHERAVKERQAVYAILDQGLACHVGYVIDGQPYVTPTAYWRTGDKVFWHGSSASKMLRHMKTGVPVCFTVSFLDGLVLARSGFHSSLNYRSVMVLGEARMVTGDDEKMAALEAFSERMTPGRWAELRPPTAQEIKATLVMSLDLDEVACKVRTGPPADDEEDYDLDVWAGVLPLRTVVGPPEDDPRLKKGIGRPAYLNQTRIE